jgi:hypothetical protein
MQFRGPLIMALKDGIKILGVQRGLNKLCYQSMEINIYGNMRPGVKR